VRLNPLDDGEPVKRTVVVRPSGLLRTPPSVTRELVLLPVLKAMPPPVADNRIGLVSVPSTPLPRSTVSRCPMNGPRASLKLIAAAELTAAVVVTVRSPRLTLTGPVRPVLFPPRARMPGPVLVRPAV